MRYLLFPVLAAFALLRSAPEAAAQFCSDDYITVESIHGVILEIKPAPDPFKTADIYISGSVRCKTMWLQVLKPDAARCRAGDRLQAAGVVTSDGENNSWQINPVSNEYMTLGVDFTCER